MAKCKLIALTTPLPGREADYHDWYQNTHLPEILALPGGISAQRFGLVAKLMGADSNQFLAVYDFECDDPGATLAAMGAAAQGGKLTMSDAQDMTTTYTAFFAECAPEVKAK